MEENEAENKLEAARDRRRSGWAVFLREFGILAAEGKLPSLAAVHSGADKLGPVATCGKVESVPMIAQVGREM